MPGDALAMAEREAEMRSSKVVHVVSCHAEGEVGDVIVGGVAPPPGETLWDQSRFIAEDETLRNFVLNEPRGGVFRHVNLLVPPLDPRAQTGWIIMEPAHTPPMSGSNGICVATVLLETGIVEIAMEGPDPDEPYFNGPRTYMKIPRDTFGEMFSSHNHGPAIVQHLHPRDGSIGE